jgi:hypothetical protein
MTIEMLNVATDANVPNTTIVIYHRQFAYSESFLVQVSWDIFFTKTYPDYNNNNDYYYVFTLAVL